MISEAVMHLKRLQASGDDKFANYQPKRAFLFPGQGAQTVGMARVSGAHPNGSIKGSAIAVVLWRSGHGPDAGPVR